MLSNAYFLAKLRFDTAENEPAKNLQKFAEFANFMKKYRCQKNIGDGLGEHEAHGVYRAGRELEPDALPAQAVEALGPAADEPADGEERDGGHRPSRRPGVSKICKN